MIKIWEVMTVEQRNLYNSLKDQMMDAVTADEVRYFANLMHELLDQVELELEKAQ